MASGESARSAEISAARRMSSLTSLNRSSDAFDTVFARRGCSRRSASSSWKTPGGEALRRRRGRPPARSRRSSAGRTHIPLRRVWPTCSALSSPADPALSSIPIPETPIRATGNLRLITINRDTTEKSMIAEISQYMTFKLGNELSPSTSRRFARCWKCRRSPRCPRPRTTCGGL